MVGHRCQAEVSFAGSAGTFGEVRQKCLNLADHGGFTGRGIDCFIRQHNQVAGMKARRQPFQAHGCNIPIGIAARPFQQVDLARQTVNKCTAQLRQQSGIFACSSRQSGIKSAVFIQHRQQFYRPQG